MSKIKNEYFDKDYMNETIGELQNKFNEMLGHISNPISGRINPTCETVFDEFEYPCWLNQKDGSAKKGNTKIQVQVKITRDENEFLD